MLFVVLVMYGSINSDLTNLVGHGVGVVAI